MYNSLYSGFCYFQVSVVEVNNTVNTSGESFSPVFKSVDLCNLGGDWDYFAVVEALHWDDTDSVITNGSRDTLDDACVDTDTNVFVNNMAIDGFFDVG